MPTCRDALRIENATPQRAQKLKPLRALRIPSTSGGGGEGKTSSRCVPKIDRDLEARGLLRERIPAVADDWWYYDCATEIELSVRGDGQRCRVFALFLRHSKKPNTETFSARSCRDGLERVEIADEATVGELTSQVSTTLGIPVDAITLSRDPKLLTTSAASTFTDLSSPRQRLRDIGVQHGEMVFMHYPFERQIQSGIRKNPFSGRTFGAKMTVDDLLAKQTRIERQETPHCASVSFDRHAANVFQQYILGALAFSIKRGGILYGTVDGDGHVLAQAIFEPPQEGSPDTLLLERQTEEERRADFLAQVFGWVKVGWIFAQSSKERDHILSAEEVCQMAAVQQELGERAVTGVVSMSTEGNVHFEAFQVSDQCVRLCKEGWFKEQAEPSGVVTLQDPKEPKKKDPVIVAGKDVGEVDVDYFLIPVNIRDHEGPLHSGFPVENRLLPQGPSQLKQHMQKYASLPYWQRLADFHLLLFLSKQPNFDLGEDIATIAEAVKHKATIPEGYTIIIDSLAIG